MTQPIHPLRRWLFENQQRIADLGAAIGVSQGNISEWMTGKKMPSWQAMVKVAEATGGAVQPNDFVGYVASKHSERVKAAQ